MPRSRWIWFVWLIVVLSYVLPYTLLCGVHAWYGSFLLWSAAGVLVIVLNVLITAGFKDEPS